MMWECNFPAFGIVNWGRPADSPTDGQLNMRVHRADESCISNNFHDLAFDNNYFLENSWTSPKDAKYAASVKDKTLLTEGLNYGL